MFSVFQPHRSKISVYFLVISFQCPLPKVLAHGEVVAAAHGGANLIEAGLVGCHRQQLALRQYGGDGAVLVEAEQLACLAVLRQRP